MPSTPLQPFAPPTLLLPFLNAHMLSTGALLAWTLFAVFFFWCVYTLVAVYHWFKYSHASTVALPAIALHLFVSLVLAVYALSGILFLK